MFDFIYGYYILFYTQKHTLTIIILIAFSIRLHGISLLINLDTVNVSQKISGLAKIMPFFFLNLFKSIFIDKHFVMRSHNNQLF